MVSSSAPTPRSGVYYFSQGWKLIGLPGIRRYVFLPLLVNVLLMGAAFWWLFTRLGSWIPSLMSHVPDWLQWLNYLLWPVVVLSILLVFGYFFSTIANWIAAPFSGLLAEQLEARLTGATPPDVGVFGIMKDIPRIMKREWQKLAWYLPRAIVLLLLYFIPGVGQTVAPVLWFLFSAWMLAIQYCDYPFDNHKVPLQNHARIAAQSQSDEYAVWGAHQPVHNDPGVKPGDPSGGYLRRHRHVGRLLSR